MPAKRPIIVDILSHVSDTERYPTMRAIFQDIRRAKSWSLTDVGNNLGTRESYAQQLENKKEGAHIYRYCTEGLRLSDRQAEIIIREHLRRVVPKKIPLYKQDEIDEFSLVIASALRFYGKTIEDLEQYVHLTPRQIEQIENGGIAPGKGQFKWETWNKPAIIEAFKVLLRDTTYDEAQMVRDAKGAFSLALKHGKNTLKPSKGR